MAIDIGTRLGPYIIEAPLGAGGMGEVYRAKDTKLDRDVAIKVLPSLFASDPDRLARFEREARAVAALSHPNILAIHDFERDPSSGITYAVMELLQGETLRQRLAAGALPLRKAVEYGVQIAQGLAGAHDKAIAHRDLKPENLFITRDDRVKILDFGLAKPLELGGAGATMADTSSTAAGTIMGTVGYMAPEQVRAQPTDHRSDIFAFGSVLYEMLSGRQAFRGDSPADTISAILNTEPPELESVTGGIPPALDRIVRRCLEKRPELRFQSARDLAFALETLTSRTSGAVAAPHPPAPASSRLPAALPWTVAALALAAAVAVWAMAGRAPRADLRWETFTSITEASGEEMFPSISPDGTTIAYASRAGGSWDIYVQRVGGRNPTVVAADPDRHETSPAFSPDGQSIAFHESDSDGGIFVAGATGESIRRVSERGFHPAWSPDGAQIAYSTEEIRDPASRQSDSGLWIIDLSGGAPRKVEGTGDASQPAWSPGGARLVYWSNTGGQRDIYTIAVAGGERAAVVEDAALDWSPVWAPDGQGVYFASDRGGAFNVWRAEVDEASGRTSGAREPVTLGVSASIEQPSISKDGRRMAFRAHQVSVNPVAIPFDPATGRAGRPRPLRNATGILEPNSVSPDGQWLAYAGGDHQEDISIGAIDGSGVRRITDDVARDRGPVWMPDGRSLVFYSTRAGRWEVWRIGRDGGGLHKIASVPDDNLVYPLLSSAGDRVVFSGVGGRVYEMTLASPGAAPRVLENTTVPRGALVATAWSPDGRKLAGPVMSGGQLVGVAVYELGSKTARMVTDDNPSSVRWIGDSRRLIYFLPSGELVLLDTESSRRTVVDVQLPASSSLELFAVAPDGRTIYYGAKRSEADIWIVERQ